MHDFFCLFVLFCFVFFQVWCYGKFGRISLKFSKISYIFTIKKKTIQKGFLVSINEIYAWKGNPSIQTLWVFLEGSGILSSNTKKKKAKNICIRHPIVSCCMLVCFMTMARKRICNTIELWKQFAKFKE